MNSPQLPARVDLTPYGGDTWSQTFRLKRGATPVDLTGATVASWAISTRGTVVHLVATIPNPTGGEIQIAIGPDGLASGTYTYDVEVTLAGGVTTWIRGTLTVTTDVTNGAVVLTHG